MIATLKNFRDPHSGNPMSRLEVDGKTFTFQGMDRVERANAVLSQYGFKRMWKEWKLVGGGCNHPECRSRSFLRIRVVPRS